MDSLKLTQIKINQHYWDFDEPYKFIAGFMKSHQLIELGDGNYREKFKRIDGEIRYWGLGMNMIERAMRTLTIKKLTEQELVRVHAYEQKKMLRFLTFIEIRKILGCFIENSGPIDENQISKLDEFNQKNRPNPRKIQNISIPAYFLLDNEFDGMNYHHEWDMNCFNDTIKLPVRNSNSRTVSKQLLNNE